MSQYIHSIEVNAPVGKLFETVTDPVNWTRYVSGLVDVRNLSPDAPARGSTFDWEYRMMGVSFTGTGTVSENVKDSAFGLRIEGRFAINESFAFAEKGDGISELTVGMQYELPGELLSLVADKLLLEKLNAIESKNVLEKVKALTEG